MKKPIVILLMLLIVAACQPAPPEDDDLPTRASFSTESATIAPTTAADTAVPATDTTTDSDAATTESTDATTTPEPTLPPTDIIPPTNTPNPTAAQVSTATAQMLITPVFSTLTPAPPGIIGAARPTSTGEPELLADVIITEDQYEDALSRQLASQARVEETQLNFTPEGIEVTLTASGGSALSTGEFLVQFDLSSGGFNNILIIGGRTEITMQGGGEPSDTFLDVVNSDVIPAVLNAFDAILNERLGEGQHNLENVVFQGDQMGVSLLVPQSSQS